MTQIQIQLTDEQATALADAYGAVQATAYEVEAAKLVAARDWRLGEIARLTAARRAGQVATVDYEKKPIHERDGREAAKASADAAVAMSRDEAAKSSAELVEKLGEEKPLGGPLPVADDVDLAEEAHAEAMRAFGELVIAACEPHQEAINAMFADAADRKLQMAGPDFDVAAGTISYRVME